MLKVSLILVVLAALSVVPSGAAKMHANPIRRVITMLQMMMKKSEDQSALEEELFDQFMCACKKNMGDLQGSIANSVEKVPQLESGLEELSAAVNSLTMGLKQAKQDRSDAEKSLSEAKTMRINDGKTYTKESTEATANIKAMGGAIKGLRKGVSQESFFANARSNLVAGSVGCRQTQEAV